MVHSIAVDTHTHCILSGHAYSTLLELCHQANTIGMHRFVLTDHGPEMLGGPPFFLPGLFRNLPHEYDGVHVYFGAELDIVDDKGDFGKAKEHMRFLEFAIASLHTPVIKSGTISQNTDALVAALDNKYIDVVGHPGNPIYPVNAETVVLAAKKKNKLIEINNHSFACRSGSAGPCDDFIKLCKKHDVRIVVGSDAHVAPMLGRVDIALNHINAAGFPAELVVNSSEELFNIYLEERRIRVGQ